jgi:hypothetical protein
MYGFCCFLSILNRLGLLVYCFTSVSIWLTIGISSFFFLVCLTRVVFDSLGFLVLGVVLYGSLLTMEGN